MTNFFITLYVTSIILYNMFHLFTLLLSIFYFVLTILVSTVVTRVTESLYDVAEKYENDKNSMIANIEKGGLGMYEDFYDEMEIKAKPESSMNILYFGPSDSFMRLDADTVLHILSYTKTEYLPIYRALQAWDIITDGKTAAFLQGREFLAFGSLLNIVPEEDLYYTNMGNPNVLKYFANYKVHLQPRKFGILVAAYRRYFGYTWYANGSRVNELGYLVCGFPPSDFMKISPSVLRELNSDVLSKLHTCSETQLQILYKTAVHPDAFGDPYKWTSHEISRLNYILKCIPKSDISSIQLEAIPAISVEVMKAFPLTKLSFFTKQQIMRMHPMTQRLYILRMHLQSSVDVNELANRNAVLSQ